VRHANRLWARHHPPPAPRWVIPASIVECESHFTNEARHEYSPGIDPAGYYQIISSTWAENGGSPPDDASQHSKAEQDAVAAHIWATAGPGAWECKA
jgi:hypothetical protein